MPTDRQKLGALGEALVAKKCLCARCKQLKTLVRLPTNFKCADVICDFCGYVAQVKTTQVADIGVIPQRVLGAAWGPQKRRMDAGIYFPLFLVLIGDTHQAWSIFYLSADLQSADIFKPRPPLGPNARRAGWQGFNYNLGDVQNHFVRLH
jgi:type II restriction enzyme